MNVFPVWQHLDLWIAGAAAITAAVCAAYFMADVLTRLDRGGRESVGQSLIALTFCLVVTLGSVTILSHEAAANTAGLHEADVAYLAAGSILLIGAGMWLFERRRQWNRMGNPDSSHLLIWAGGLLLVTLWLVQRGVEELRPDTGTATQLFGTIVGAGVLAMAIVQGLRTLLPLRGVFHRIALERWIDDATTPARHEGAGAAASASDERTARGKHRQFNQATFDRRQQVFSTVTHLARGPVSADRYALLDLPIEQLCGQIAAGADRLLDAPFPETLVTRGSDRQPARVKDVLQALAAGGDEDILQYLKLADALANKTTTEKEPGAGTPPAAGLGLPPDTQDAVDAERVARTQEYMRLRAGISHRIQRNIDGLQIATTFWWRRVLRGLAFTICGALGLSVFGGRVTYSVLCAIVGGFVATASRDVVAVIEKARR